MNNLGLVYRLEGRLKEAEPLYVRSLELERKILGNDHSETAVGAGNLGNLYSLMGEYSKAEPLLIESMETRRRIWGEEHPDTLDSLDGLGALYPPFEKLRVGLPGLVGILELDNVGHWVQHEASAEVSDQLVKFLRIVKPG